MSKVLSSLVFLGIGIVLGLFVAEVSNKLQPVGDSPTAVRLKQIDDDLLKEYAKGFGYAAEGFGCVGTFDADCMNATADKINGLTEVIKVKVDQRNEFVEDNDL